MQITKIDELSDKLKYSVKSGNAPIGVFDSGYGGLTVLKEIVRQLPQYDYLYLGDNARTPYGTRSFKTIYEYTLESVKYLFDQGCPLIILACNTASARALRSIQQKDLPSLCPENRVLGIIRPTAEVIGHHTKSKSVAVLGTPGTVKSESYILEIEKQFPDIKVVQQACPMWVPLVENGETDNQGSDFFIRKYLTELFTKDHKVDTLLLACTHYPLLMTGIKKYVDEEIKILSQGRIVAESLENYLFRHPEMETRLSRQGNRTFLTTGSENDFSEKASAFYGKSVRAKNIHL